MAFPRKFLVIIVFKEGYKTCLESRRNSQKRREAAHTQAPKKKKECLREADEEVSNIG